MSCEPIYFKGIVCPLTIVLGTSFLNQRFSFYDRRALFPSLKIVSYLVAEDARTLHSLLWEDRGDWRRGRVAVGWKGRT